MKDYEQTWKEFWEPLLVKEGTLDIDQVKRELHDYVAVMKMVPIVYDHITGGRITGIHSKPEHVISAAADHFRELILPDCEE